jgi:hypothetical protein
MPPPFRPGLGRLPLGWPSLSGIDLGLPPSSYRPRATDYLYPEDVAPAPAPPPRRQYTPLEDDPSSLYQRALDSASSVGRFLSTPIRGVGTSIAMLRGTAEGDPLRYVGLAPGGMESTTGEDALGAFGLGEPPLTTPDPVETVKEGYLAGAAAAGGENLVGERLGLGRAGTGLADLTPQERQEWEEANPAKAYTKALGGVAADIVLPFGLDPTLATLGAAGSYGTAGRGMAEVVGTGVETPVRFLERGAALGDLGHAILPAVEKVSPAFVAPLAVGATQNLKSAYDRYQDEGMTPQTVREAASGAAEAAFAALGLGGALAGLRGRLRRGEGAPGSGVPLPELPPPGASTDLVPYAARPWDHPAGVLPEAGIPSIRDMAGMRPPGGPPPRGTPPPDIVDAQMAEPLPEEWGIRAEEQAPGAPPPALPAGPGRGDGSLRGRPPGAAAAVAAVRGQHRRPHRCEARAPARGRARARPPRGPAAAARAPARARRAARRGRRGASAVRGGKVPPAGAREPGDVRHQLRGGPARAGA